MPADLPPASCLPQGGARIVDTIGVLRWEKSEGSFVRVPQAAPERPALPVQPGRI